MKRSEMVCGKCIKYHHESCACRLWPIPEFVRADHWCSKGVWHFWSERYDDLEPIYWGEWEVEK